LARREHVIKPLTISGADAASSLVEKARALNPLVFS
jgi:hypothetical protein